MSQAPPLRPAILIVSDTAFADPSTDKAGSALTETFSVDGAGRWEEPIIEIVKDDVLEIQRAVRSWSDGEGQDSGPINLIVTTGGTGFARRDFTPEAISPLIHRHAPGIVHGMLSASFQVTPFAMMSRPVAGVRNKSIIVTLPGSPKGAKENLQAILKLLPHACMQAAGEDSRQAHAGGVSKLEKDAGISSSTAKPAVGEASHGHSHHHHHHDRDHGHGHGGHKVPKAHTDPSQRPHQSNDPRLGATARARSSPYPMLSVEEAVAKIIEQSPSPIVEIRDVSPDLAGYVLAEDIKAAEAVPAYRASIVDGYAVIVPSESDKTSSTSAVTSIKGIFPVASVSHAQAASLPPPLQPGQIARITTGAPLPENANAVVMVEDTTIASLTDDQSEEATVEILTSELAIGENIREPGSDIQLSEVVLTKGTSISRFGGEVGVLAAAGIAQVPVYRKARIGILSTGDEVTDVSNTNNTKGQTLTNGMIRDSNRPSLLTLVGQWPVTGAVVDLGIARDTPTTALEEALRAGYRDHDLDIIVTTGGVSMGELDLLKPTVERSLGGTVHFGRISMKPGKPTTFASIPFKPSSSSASTSSRESRLLFGLPGNPASALVTANLFLLPCIQQIGGYGGGGAAAKGLERVTVTVDSRIRCDPTRVEYHRVRVRFVGTGSGQQHGRLVASSTGMQRSSRVASLASANALLQLPLREGYLEKGDECVALLLASP
ncbi:hypothetical protein B0A52_05326 [Exophiala mesophila]|uniref:MoaB/Mog domain-containing protein n=1 Tax=Exophiala mesophila TaxID=212818 RepID=A0A438N4L6_EXOME|nr:hypothetical protein B0A52_05326 [Exophiala mesophila]